MLYLQCETLSAEIDPHGATIRSLAVRDRSGAELETTVNAGTGHAGATVGRYANRIAGAQFELDGKTYHLIANDGRNTLHGGPRGFNSVDWNVFESGRGRCILEYISPDGDQGFPGEMRVSVAFTVSDTQLAIDYAASCDRDTVINLTNHSYFNLTGGKLGAAEHSLWIDADAFTPLDAELLPTGEILSVAGTRYDFGAPRAIGEAPYDMNWVINGSGLRHAGTLSAPDAGWQLDVATTEPGLQVYTGKPNGVALETQHFADSPHHPQFPSTVLRAGEHFSSRTVYRFISRDRRP